MATPVRVVDSKYVCLNMCAGSTIHLGESKQTPAPCQIPDSGGIYNRDVRPRLPLPILIQIPTLHRITMLGIQHSVYVTALVPIHGTWRDEWNENSIHLSYSAPLRMNDFQ